MASELEKFLEERSKIPIPGGDVAQVKLLAKELALGVHRGLWERTIRVGRSYDEIIELRSGYQQNLQPFIENRWGDKSKSQIIELLIGYEFVIKRNAYEIAPAAFGLVDETEPYNIFISYRRLDSSALALLVLARLREHSLVPFVDMALEVGGDWHANLEDRIKASDYFIILLGKDTLSSPMTVKEISWAIDYERTIIPLWHNEFGQEEEFDLRQHIDEAAVNWKDERLLVRKDEVHDVIQQTQAIIVQSESAKEYNSGIVELLNRFGVTP